MPRAIGTLWDDIYGIGDAAATIGSGMLAEPL